MGKNPLVEVLGSFASNVVMSYGNSMHIDMGIKISVNFSKFPVILLVPVL